MTAEELAAKDKADAKAKREKEAKAEAEQRSPHSNLHHLPVGDRVAVSRASARMDESQCHSSRRPSAPTRVGNVRVSGFVMRLNALRCGRVGVLVSVLSCSYRKWCI